jgi:hypothetical protein
MLNKVALLVISCDKYSDLWPIYFGSLFKYWPNCPLKIYLGSNYKIYDHKDVTTINVGEDRDYSSNLKAMISQIEEEYVITTVEDMFLSSPVDEEHLFPYFQEFFDNKGAYLKLLYTYPVGYDDDVSKRTASLASDVRYRLGMGTSLWNRKILLENLVPGMSAWIMEKEGEFGKDIPAGDVYSINYHFSRKGPLPYVHGVIKGAWTRKAISWLIKEGYQDLLPNRQRLSWSRTLYVWMFGILMAIFRKINYKWRL